jgi:hypothetical protein
MFLLAALSRRARPLAVNIGVVAGVAANLVLWLFFKNVFWFWWNAIGAVITLVVGLGLSRFLPAGPAAAVPAAEPAPAGGAPWKEVGILATWFVLIVAFCLLLPRFF